MKFSKFNRIKLLRYHIAFAAFWLILASLPAAAVNDPGLPGPYQVTRTEYDFGDSAFTPQLSNFPGPIEFRGSVHYPSDLKHGPYPLIVLLHGRHSTCFDPDNPIGTEGDGSFLGSFSQWPCDEGREPIPSFTGYDYLAENLASYGMIVISISANGINARDDETPDAGMSARAELIHAHLELWDSFNTQRAEPFGELFVDRVDLSNVGTLGHSRGGEGVVIHNLLNTQIGSPFGVKAVMPLAAVNFLRTIPNNVPLGVVLPYCDGDVFNLEGLHYFDDALYNVTEDLAGKHTILSLGANHNFYNTIWTPEIFPSGAIDDWTYNIEGIFGLGIDSECNPEVTGNGRLTAAEQRASLRTFATAFFLNYLQGQTELLPILSGDEPPPPSSLTDRIFLTYHAPYNRAVRLDVNRLVDETNLSINTLGGVVKDSLLWSYDLCGGPPPQPLDCLLVPGFIISDGQIFFIDAREPHVSTPEERDNGRPGLSQLRIGGFGDFSQYVNTLPDKFRDLSNYTALQFRASVNFEDSRNPPGQAQDLKIRLIDGTGASAMARVSDWSKSLFYPPGDTFPITPRITQNGVRIPLSAFDTIDLTDILAVNLEFDAINPGALIISNLAVTQ